MAKATSPEIAKLASRVLSESYKPTDAEVQSMAASLVAQAEPDPETPPGPEDVVIVKVTRDGVEKTIERGVAKDHPDIERPDERIQPDSQASPGIGGPRV